MKQLQVIVKDKNTLVLLEDGQRDDQINLADLANVDLTAIEEAINSGREQIFQKKLNELRVTLEQERTQALEIQRLELSKTHVGEVQKLEEVVSTYEANKALEIEKINSKHSSEVSELKALIARLEETNNQSLVTQKLELENQYNQMIAKIQKDMQYEIDVRSQKIQILTATQEKAIENEKLQLEQKYISQIEELKQQISKLTSDNEVTILRKESEYEEVINKLKIDHAEEISKKEAIINEKEIRYQELQNRKASLGVKMIGEELEIWCNNEMESYMQNGFFNCKWIKDNKVVRDEEESKGSKADYIFNIYASESCNDDELLAGVCLEMKDENPNSVHRKKNADYLKALHANRVKKGCKYAVLVSNLELDNPNDLPILRVREYPDMYIVRPGYMVVLLNMITSLTTNFKDLLLQANKEKLEVKARTELLEQFEKLKQTYLEKGLETLEKNVNDIKKKSASIIEAAESIDKYCNTIITSYLNTIKDKLDKFQVNISREYRKFEKKEN